MRFDLKTGVKIFGQYKNNGIKKCPLLRISPLFQKKVEVMDTIKSMEIYLVKLLIRRSLVQVQQGEPKNPECESVQDFYFLPIHSSLNSHSGFLESNK